jgi:hypothetical protein
MALVEKAPQVPDHRRPLLEDRAGLRVDGEVEVPLPVPPLDVLQAVPFFRERAQALGQELEGLRLDRQLAGPGPEDLPRDAEPVAQVQGAAVPLVPTASLRT